MNKTNTFIRSFEVWITDRGFLVQTQFLLRNQNKMSVSESDETVDVLG